VQFTVVSKRRKELRLSRSSYLLGHAQFERRSSKKLRGESRRGWPEFVGSGENGKIMGGIQRKEEERI
jgi:hypothetical protein